MTRAVLYLTLICALSAFLWGQSGQNAPAFEIADVHDSPLSNPLNQFARGPFAAGSRYELRKATVLDLIRIACSLAGPRMLDLDRVVGGPDSLDFARFD
jgi:hypothetical protein